MLELTTEQCNEFVEKIVTLAESAGCQVTADTHTHTHTHTQTDRCLVTRVLLSSTGRGGGGSQTSVIVHLWQ